MVGSADDAPSPEPHHRPEERWTLEAEHSRRLARVVAVQALYEADVAGHPAAIAVRRRAAEAGLKSRLTAFAVRLVDQVEKDRVSLDGRIAGAARAWPVDQLPAIDRAILRLALTEASLDPETPLKVVIDEAIELAKLLASEGSPRFVNGVLGTVLG